jgi:beta-barrel assembly-enhancing protease
MFRQTLTAVAAALTLTVAACGVSTQQEVDMGAQYSAEINRQLPLVNDGQVVSYINQLGDNIARAGGRGLNYTFYVVNSDVVNAFAVPGGYIYINRGLIERAGSMSEVAGVLAHEIGHVEQRHGVEQMEKMQGANLGLNLAYVLLGRRPGQLEQTGVQALGSIVFAKFSRDDENEADQVAVPLMVSSRINANGLITMFQRLTALQRTQPSAMTQWFSTHPTNEERINHTRSVIAATQGAASGTNDTREFQRIRSRLRSMAPAPRSQQ